MLLKATPSVEMVRVKNRLNEGTQDLLLNFVYCAQVEDKRIVEEPCFFICEMQLALSTANEEVTDHFNHFLYELFRAPYGMIAELGIMLYSLDSRMSFITKKELAFVPKDKNRFIFNGDEKELRCVSHPEDFL